MDSEDILQEALEFLGGQPVVDDSVILYGPLSLTVAPKEGKANTLLADHLFSPALLLAERIERGLLDVAGKKVVELGAGCALPYLLLTTIATPPSLIVVTDYPDDVIMDNLKRNVERNRTLRTTGCLVECGGYAWGSDPCELLTLARNPPCERSAGFDVMILSDLLHFKDSHDLLVQSIQLLLSKTHDARVYIGAGKYTHKNVCDSFLSKGTRAGLVIEEIFDNEPSWMGTPQVSGLTLADLELRKANCRFWVGRWA